jgi:hypothetical protein
VQASPFDEVEFFRAIANSGARVLMIGRRALVALGLPVMTTDYDFWTLADEAAALNDAVRTVEMYPNKTPEQARQVGKYVLEGDNNTADVFVAKSIATQAGVSVFFEDLWVRRNYVKIATDVAIAIPSLDDLILTKQFGNRPRDADDIRLLQWLKTRTAP